MALSLKVKGTNVVLSEDISDYLDKRLQAFDKFIDPDDTSVLCNVELEKTTDHHQHGDIFRAEINLHIAGHDFRAESSKSSLNDAIDDAKNDMTRELRRLKRKRLSLTRRSGARLKEFIRGFRKK